MVLSTLAGGKKKKQKKSKANKTQTLNDFLATGTTFAKDQPKRTGSWADAMEEKLDAEGEILSVYIFWNCNHV